MKIPRFWHRANGTAANEYDFCTWGWSFTSIEDAKKSAAERLKNIIGKFNRNEELKKGYYLENPLREEIMDTVRHGENEVAVITRNRYGALILNTGKVMFADIDFPEKPEEPISFWKLLFSKHERGWAKPQFDEHERERTMQRVRDWLAKNPMKSLRLYMTAGGLRLLFTDKLYEPRSPETIAIFQQLGTDSLYVKLTNQQECFRARLTPKPWRCECCAPPKQFPFDNKDHENEYRDWEKYYDRQRKSYSTCRLIGQFGNAAAISEIESVVTLHDKYCLDESANELA